MELPLHNTMRNDVACSVRGHHMLAPDRWWDFWVDRLIPLTLGMFTLQKLR
jgi:hypothetical protein